MDPIDIEDLNKLAQQHSHCPYYFSTDMAKDADIVFMPYPYLLDQSTQKNFGLDLKNSIIIVDEAHNIKEQAEQVQSFEISQDIMIKCLGEMKDYEDYIYRNEV